MDKQFFFTSGLPRAGTSFTITSSSTTDTSIVAWQLINP